MTRRRQAEPGCSLPTVRHVDEANPCQFVGCDQKIVREVADRTTDAVRVRASIVQFQKGADVLKG